MSDLAYRQACGHSTQQNFNAWRWGCERASYRIVIARLTLKCEHVSCGQLKFEKVIIYSRDTGDRHCRHRCEHDLCRTRCVFWLWPLQKCKSFFVFENVYSIQRNLSKIVCLAWNWYYVVSVLLWAFGSQLEIKKILNGLQWVTRNSTSIFILEESRAPIHGTVTR